MAKREGVERRVRPLLHGWPRHAAGKRRRVTSKQLQREIRRIGVGRIATRVGPLLRHGSRQALGSHRARVRRDGATATARSPTDPVARRQAVLRARRHRRVHRAGDDRRCATSEPVGLIRDDDACIFFNYRADRGREMTQALTEAPLKLHFTTMTQYDKTFPRPFRAAARASQQHPGQRDGAT